MPLEDDLKISTIEYLSNYRSDLFQIEALGTKPKYEMEDDLKAKTKQCYLGGNQRERKLECGPAQPSLFLFWSGPLSLRLKFEEDLNSGI